MFIYKAQQMKNWQVLTVQDKVCVKKAAELTVRPILSNPKSKSPCRKSTKFGRLRKFRTINMGKTNHKINKK